MRRKLALEEHSNHEAWAIPYGDLVTLLLAFFVVMYSISSVNEGKYRVVSNSLSQAFGGSLIEPGLPTSTPLGTTNSGQNLIASQLPRGLIAEKLAPALPEAERLRWQDTPQDPDAESRAQAQQALTSIANELERALGSLIMEDLVQVYRRGSWLEVEIKSDMLFGSGSAAPRPDAAAAVARVARVLSTAPNLIRIEGHTDDRPIASLVFPSNWELSAARSASIARVLIANGVAPGRLTVVGFGEHQPIADNVSEAGRNSNRRVVLVILAGGPDGDPLAPPTQAGDA
jgi:chemotaxis protein MotB